MNPRLPVNIAVQQRYLLTLLYSKDKSVASGTESAMQLH